ncbi:MAG TPA: hypothetical protein VFR43_08530 [Gaiellaceae bacterium]|nr:hypothetical protein [Gaiellaceae bacterium]
MSRATTPLDGRSRSLRWPAFRPRTELGQWAVGLAAAWVVLVLAWRALPGGAAFGLACGLAGGTAGVVAIVRDRERAVSVFAAVLPLLFVVGFVLAELLVGHG